MLCVRNIKLFLSFLGFMLLADLFLDIDVKLESRILSSAEKFRSATDKTNQNELFEEPLRPDNPADVNDTVFEPCQIVSTDHLKPGATIIVGHAYGNWNKHNGFIAPKLEAFLKNMEGIKRVVFTGDVFHSPTLRKWSRLQELAKSKNFELYVAPGNHDLGQRDDSRRDVYNLSGLTNPNEYPIIFDDYGYTFVIENSQDQIEYSQKTMDLMQTSERKVFVLRHHVGVKNFGYLSNIPVNNQSLMDFSEFKDIPVTIISGDTGASEKQPRLVCFGDGKARHIMNGLGQQPGDTILMIHQNGLEKVIL